MAVAVPTRARLEEMPLRLEMVHGQWSSVDVTWQVVESSVGSVGRHDVAVVALVVVVVVEVLVKVL